MSADVLNATTLLKRWTEEVGEQGRLDVVPELVANRITIHGPEGQRSMSAGDYAAFLGAQFAAMPSRRYLIDDALVTPEWIWTRFRLAASGLDGAERVMSGLQVFRIEAGKLAETWRLATPPGIDWSAPIEDAPSAGPGPDTEPVDLPRRMALINIWTDAVWHGGHLDRVPDCVDEAYFRHGAQGSRVATPGGYAAEIGALRAKYPDQRFTSLGQALTERVFWYRYVLTGTDVTSGQSMVMSGLQVYGIRNNRLAETWALSVPGIDWRGAA